MFPIETREHRLGATELDLLFEQRSLGAGCRCIGKTGSQILCVQVERQLHPLDGRPLAVEEMVDSNPVHPRRERSVAAERGDPRQDFDEDLLGRVFGVGRLSDHAEGESVHTVSRRFDELLDGFGVTGLGRGDQMVVFQLGHAAVGSPRGWSTSTRQLPSSWRRTTSALVPPSSTWLPSGATPAIVQRFVTRAISSLITTSGSFA